ncbi:hypothetical protein [Streptomyces californicus]|uniref:hypothetical protein n=1 Tax=Streptomyces californicus TaxID=67351 RepID=UPI0037B57283
MAPPAGPFESTPVAGGLLERVRAVVSRYPYGVVLPTGSELARELGVSVNRVRIALGALEAAGETVLRDRVRRFRLYPHELHPMDTAFDRAVREDIAQQVYAPGTALPAGLLGRRHGVAPQHLGRACRRLIADRLVTYRDGPAGPGYYLPDSTPAASAQQRRGTDGD